MCVTPPDPLAFPPPQVSGSTVSLVTLVGWQLTVANVGDSCVYLDTGSEVIQARFAGSRA